MKKIILDIVHDDIEKIKRIGKIFYCYRVSSLTAHFDDENDGAFTSLLRSI
jgi:hypothetical protein